ncbi:hypothetical protein [Devosia sp. CN2-171]|uniref:hypothetical protein n=1 Tax=Devosia sp. CN2-171 TaxID=3400909 RepID=UPI003BF87C81
MTVEGTEPPGADGIRRQAIVVVHGQGQQRPMETLRGFVEVLWTRNPDLGAVPLNGRRYFIVPDSRTEIFDLQRITTPDGEGRKTDFFELYYADLLANTPLRNLWLWLTRLLFIDPVAVTDELRNPWRFLWVLSLIAFGLFVWVALSIPHLLHFEWVRAFERPHATIAAAMIGAILLLLVLPKFIDGLSGLQKIPGSVLIAAIAVLFNVMFWGSWVMIGATVLSYIVYFAVSFVLPLFGDAASYLSAQTETIASRQALRKRGLTLLKALHDDPKYDRIVLVAHSLGTVLAYDLLQLLWEQVGPTKDNKPTAKALAALGDVQAFVALNNGADWVDAIKQGYQDKQWAAFSALRIRRRTTVTADVSPAKPATEPWKVSDFVTLGSPLGHSRCLIAEGQADFDRLKAERLLSYVPPVPFDGSISPGFIDAKSKAVHHAALFSVVRWTNLYDTFNPWFFAAGDAISSRLGMAERFGPGVLDVDARMHALPGTWFTHNSYWVDLKREGAVNLAELRKAVGIGRPL